MHPPPSSAPPTPRSSQGRRLTFFVSLPKESVRGGGGTDLNGEDHRHQRRDKWGSDLEPGQRRPHTWTPVASLTLISVQEGEEGAGPAEEQPASDS